MIMLGWLGHPSFAVVPFVAGDMSYALFDLLFGTGSSSVAVESVLIKVMAGPAAHEQIQK